MLSTICNKFNWKQIFGLLASLTPEVQGGIFNAARFKI